MNFDLNAKSSPQRRPKTHSRPAARPSYSPKSPQLPSTASVPISVYRELSAELQATQTMLDSLHGQNQHLRKQNIHLQQEVDSIVQAAQQMQQGGARPDLAQGQQPEGALNEQLFAAPPSQDNVGYPGGNVPPQLRRGGQPYAQQSTSAMPPRVSEPPRPQEMPITPEGIEPLVVSPPAMQRASNEAQRSNQPSSHDPAQSASAFSPSRRQAAVETLNQIFTGREQPLPRRSLEDESSEEIHTGWLVLIVLLIVVTAFGTGFMIVRPFLSTNR